MDNDFRMKRESDLKEGLYFLDSKKFICLRSQ